MNRPLDLLASCAFGLEAIVRRELKELGYDGRIVGPGRVHFGGDLTAVCRANLWLRAADRVLIQVADFPAADFDTLFEVTRALPWAEWIPGDGCFPVIGRSLQSQLSSVPACQRTVKKAVVESLLRDHGVAALPEDGSLYRIEIAIHKDQARLTIDTTGPSLHKRGYRQQAAAAPLKETLAAAMVLLSFWNRDRPLIDPFCGSGTIPIEAALIGQQIAPGLERDFPAEQWPIFASQQWRECRAEAEQRKQPGLDERIIGGDVDARALAAARANADRAGVGGQIHFQQQRFEDLTSKRKYGCVITNPPYGARLGEQWEWDELYRSIPQVLRRLPTWSHFILTSYPRFESVVQKQANRRRKLYNGRIECTYYQFHGPKAAPKGSAPQSEAVTENEPAANEASAGRSTPTNLAGQGPAGDSHDDRAAIASKRPVADPVFGGLTSKAFEQAEIFSSRLAKRARHLRRWPTKQGITCFRLYERDIPEIPLVVDRYEDCLHITEYERPHDRDVAQHADWLDLMAKTASDVLQVERRKVFFKSRQRQRGDLQHVKVADSQSELTVGEGGLKFIVNLSDYVDTGLFLDHRITRSMVRDDASGARFLNLFGYTGSFSVYAAAGGAVETTTVDWTRAYLDWAQRNMRLNEFVGPQHQFVREDARTFLQQHDRDSLYDLAVVDPPTFSNSKRSEAVWQVQDDHVQLFRLLLPLMRPNGVIYFSSNYRRFKLNEAAMEASQIREISGKTVPADFRNRRIHRCWRIVR